MRTANQTQRWPPASQRVLDHIRAISDTEAEKGRLFERLMKAYFLKDAVYRNRFSNVWLWSEWAGAQTQISTPPTPASILSRKSETAATAPSNASATPPARACRAGTSTPSSPRPPASPSPLASSWTPATSGEQTPSRPSLPSSLPAPCSASTTSLPRLSTGPTSFATSRKT